MRAEWIRRRFTNNHWSGHGYYATDRPHTLSMDGATWLFGTTGAIGVAVRGDFAEAPFPDERAGKAIEYLTHAGERFEFSVPDLKLWAGPALWGMHGKVTDYGEVLGAHINKPMIALLLDGVNDETVLISAASRLERKGHPDTLTLSAVDDSWRGVVAGVRRQSVLPGGGFQPVAKAEG